MARVNINILGISELKWTGMGEFNADDHYIYYCGQESSRRNGVAIMVNKRVWNAVLGCNLLTFSSVQFSSVAQSCPTLCSPMNLSMPGLPVHHQLPEFTQTHVYRVSDAIQPSHPLSSPSPPTFNLSQHQSLFQSVLHIRRPTVGASASVNGQTGEGKNEHWHFRNQWTKMDWNGWN